MTTPQCPCVIAGGTSTRRPGDQARRRPAEPANNPIPAPPGRCWTLLEHLNLLLDQTHKGNRTKLRALAEEQGAAYVPSADDMTKQLGGKTNPRFETGPTWEFIVFWLTWCDYDAERCAAVNLDALEAHYAELWRAIHGAWPEGWTPTAPGLARPDSTEEDTLTAVKELAFEATAELRGYHELALALTRGAEAEFAQFRDEVNEVKTVLRATQHNKSILEERLLELLAEQQKLQDELNLYRARNRNLGIETVQLDRQSIEQTKELDRLRQENKLLRERLRGVVETEFQQIVGNLAPAGNENGTEKNADNSANDSSRAAADDNAENPADQGSQPPTHSGDTNPVATAKPRRKIAVFYLALTKHLR